MIEEIKLKHKLEITNPGKNNPEALRVIILALIENFNDTIKAYQEFQKRDFDFKKIYGQAIVFNLTIIHKITNVLNSIKDSNPELSKIRNCIAHLDERILLLLKGKKIIPRIYNTDKIQYEGGQLKSMVGVSSYSVNLNIDEKNHLTSVYVYSLGFLDDYIVGLNEKLETIMFKLDENILQFYKKAIENVIDKYAT